MLPEWLLFFGMEIEWDRGWGIGYKV